MKKIFTFLVAFLTTVSGAVWGQERGTRENPLDIGGRTTPLEINDDEDWFITTSSQNTGGIKVLNGKLHTDGKNPTIYLMGVDIKAGGSAIEIEYYSKPTLVILGENTIHSTGTDAAIKIPTDIAPGADLTISEESTGILNIIMDGNEDSFSDKIAIGNTIEGNSSDIYDCGTLSVNGGTIKTNGRIGRFNQHSFTFSGNAIVIANDIVGFDYNDEDMRKGGLLFLNDDTPYVGEFHTPEEDPEFTLSSPLPEPYKIEVRSGGVEVTIGNGQSLTESQVDLQGGTLNAYKVSYESSTELPFIVPSTKYHGPKYSTESLSDDTKNYQGGKYALVTTHLWESTAETPAWVEAGKKQDKTKTGASGVEEVKYTLVGTLTEKELNLKADVGLTENFNLWYPASITITAEEEESSDDGDLSAYGMQMTDGTIQKSASFTSLTETSETQEVQINLSALPSVSAIEPAVLKINVDADVTPITDQSIKIALNDPDWVYDGKEKTNLSDLVTVQKTVGDEIRTYTYNAAYTIEFSLDKDDWTPVTPKDANENYYVKVIGKGVLSGEKILDETVSIAKAALTIKVTTTPRVDVGTDLANVEFPASTFLTIETAVEGEDVNLVGNLTIKESVSADKEQTIEDAFSHDNVTLEADKETSSPFKESNYTETWPDKISLIVGKITINPGGDGEEGDDVIGGEDTNGDGNFPSKGDFILISPDGEECSVYDGQPHELKILQIGDYTLKADEDYKVTSYGTTGNPKNAGTYTATIELVADGKYQLENGETSFDLTIHIAERLVTVGFDLPASIDASTKTLDASQYADWQKAGETGVPANAGLVGTENPICEGTLALVESADYPGCFNVYLERETFKVKDNSPFLVSNYVISVEGNDGQLIELEETEDGGEETLPEGEDDPTIDEGGIEIEDDNIGGGGVFYDYNDLILYESDGATLSSRHKKMRVRDGGSFTVSLKIDEAYAGAEPIVYVKRGRGEWTPWKLDEVSGYYQIRDVYTDIYVKVMGDGIWVVGNEDITATDARAYAQPNKIVVITPQPTDVQIISMAGAVVATDKVTGQREFANLTEGVYIVRMGETVVKLQVRK